MRRLILLVLLFQGWRSFAQTVEWMRQFSMGTNSSSVAGSVFSSDSVLYSIATVRKWGYNPSGSATLRGLGLVKTRTFNGDTVFVRRLQGYSSRFSGAKMLKSFEGNFVMAVVSTSDTIFDSKILVQKVDTNGNPIWMLPLSAGLNDPQVIKVLAAPDGGTFILGSDFSTIGGLQDWLLIKVSYTGQLLWSQRYSGGLNWYCEANNMEPLRNGNYLISGMAERQVWAIEIDPDGNQVSQRVIYETPLPYLLLGAQTAQGYHKSYYSFGVVQSNPRRFYFSKKDSLFQTIWGGEQSNLLGQFYANTAGGHSVLLSGKAVANDSLFINLVSWDSTVFWRIGLPRSGLSPHNPTINDVAFDGFGNAILCGSKKRQNSNRDELFFMKISGVGLPYDPFADTVLVSNRNLKNQEKLIVYPNPATDKIWFSGLKGPFQVVLYSADGRKLVEKEMDERTHLSLNDLPYGLYTYRIGKRDKWWTGKIIKE